MPEISVQKRRFRFPRRWRVALSLLAGFFLLGLWFIARNHVTASDFQFAHCGSELWLSGSQTSCGEPQDALLAYRIAGLPIMLDLWRARGADVLSKPEERSLPAVAGSLLSRPTGAELRTHLPHMGLLLRLPFLLAGVLLGGCLWWVTRRLYGNSGGYTALAFFFCSPSLLRAITAPNAEVLAALGLYAGLYACIGVAHALQGPRRKWRPRMVLLAVLLGLAAAAHLLALAAILILALPMMFWLAESRRRAIPLVMAPVLLGAAIVLFACAGFSLRQFGALFQPSLLSFGLSLEPSLQCFGSPARIGLTLAVVLALALCACMRRAIYFGNIAPLLCAVLLMLVEPHGVEARPWLWAQVFLISFVAGVFADAYETRRGRWVKLAALLLVATQAVCCLLSLTGRL